MSSGQIEKIPTLTEEQLQKRSGWIREGVSLNCSVDAPVAHT